MAEEKITPQDRALRRVRRLLDLAEDQGSSEAERENAMTQAMQLMADYGINEAMANARGQIREQIISKRIMLGNPYSYDKANLLGWLGDELNCQQVNHRRGRVFAYATIIGYESDVVRLEMLYTSLLMQAMREIRAVRPPWVAATSAETRAYRQNWFEGFNNRVTDRVAENERKARQKFEDEHAGETGTALVVADRKTQVDAFVAKAHPNLKDPVERDRSGLGYSEGAEAANRADIGNGKVESGDQYKIGPGRG